jgi:hypothetical protein
VNIASSILPSNSDTARKPSSGIEGPIVRSAQASLSSRAGLGKAAWFGLRPVKKLRS